MKIEYPAFISQTFPKVPQTEIWRENLLTTIRTTLDGEIDVLFLEGPEGIGKTVLSSQFARELDGRIISLFLRNTSKLAYDPYILRMDLCQQIYFILDKGELPDAELIDEGFLRNLLYKLHRDATKPHKSIYFVIDGLDEIPSGEHEALNSVLELLPWGMRGFQFLISGDKKVVPESNKRCKDSKSFIIPGFSLDDTIRYFSDLELERSTVEDIYKSSKGLPGHLEAIRRILQSGTDREKLLADLPEQLPSLFEVEWQPVDSGSEQLKNIVAILAYDKSPHTTKSLSELIGVSETEVVTSISKATFLVTDSANNTISFVSDSYRRFASKKLQKIQQRVSNLMISSLLSNPDSRPSLLYLPGYLEQAGRLDELVTYLSADHIGRMVEHTGSWKPVQRQTSRGIAAARKLERDADLVRLGIQESSIVQFEQAETWRAQVEAYMALGMQEAALELANATVSQEDRLHLLAVICRAKKRRKQGIEPELDEQVRNLFGKIDKAGSENHSLDIAADLVYSHADLAIELVRASTSNDEGEKNISDIKLAQFSIGMIGSVGDVERKHDALAALRKQIENPRLKSFSSTLSLLFGDYSADEVIAEVENLKGAEGQISLLRQWCHENSHREDALIVVKYALDLVVKSTRYSPNARVYREIASPLPVASDIEQCKSLVAAFNSQKGTTLRLGPTIEHIRLEMLLAATEWKYDTELCQNRIEDNYLFVSDISDASVKTACLAQLYTTVTRIDTSKVLESSLKLHSSLEADLQSNINILLSQTARQFQATKEVIRFLAVNDINWAIDVCRRLNIQIRRDRGFREIVKSRCKLSIEKLEAKQLILCIDEIHDQDLKESALLTLINALALPTDGPTYLTPVLNDLIIRTQKLENLSDKCRAICLLISTCHKSDKLTKVAESLEQQLQTTLQSIDISWLRISTYYKIASSFAEHSVDKARMFLQQAEHDRPELRMDDETTAYTYVFCVLLVIRAFSGLLTRRNEFEGNAENIGRLIEEIPSCGVRAQLYSSLALSYHLSRRTEETQQIVSEKVKPLLLLINDQDQDFRAFVIIYCAPSLYCAHKATAFDFFKLLNADQKDEALDLVCKLILWKVSPIDPYETIQGREYIVTFEDIRDICELLLEMSSDSMIYGYIDKIASTISVAQKKHKFSEQQVSDIKARIREISSRKFPNQLHITHEGYKIVAEAQIGRIEIQKPLFWDGLIARANALPNLADTAYVLSAIGACISSKHSVKRTEVFKMAKECVEKIPADIDRIERMEALADEASSADRTFAKECLMVGMKHSFESPEENLQSAQRRMIDLAHRIDPTFAASLASLADTDPAKREKLEYVKDRLETLEERDDILKEKEKQLDGQKVEQYVAAARVLFGQLNSGRVHPLKIESLRRFIEAAGQLPLRRSYAMLSWVFANLVKKYSDTPHAAKFIRPTFESSILAAELALRMATNSLGKSRRHVPPSTTSEVATNIVVHPGERPKALEFIKRWIENNVRDYIKISDPYFGPSELELVKLIRAVDKEIPIEILTSRHHINQECGESSVEEAFRHYWRMHISSEDAGDTTITVAGGKASGQYALHDRWWLTSQSGLRVGTSFGSLGITKEAEISTFDFDESVSMTLDVDNYLSRKIREFRGDRMIYSVFTLD